VPRLGRERAPVQSAQPQINQKMLQIGETHPDRNAQMVELGEAFHLSKGSEKNFKLTTYEDIEIFKALLDVKSGTVP
jgi:2-C-methyl-D-erythritol 4-phosphate cytidylyltransferase